MTHVLMKVPHQLAVVCSYLVGVGVGEEEQLGVGVDGEVGLDDTFVPADEVGDVLHFDLRLGTVSTESVAAGVAGSSQSCDGGKTGLINMWGLWMTATFDLWQNKVLSNCFFNNV